MVDSGVQSLIFQWYDRAQVDYNDLYARLYISYNAWFRKVTHTGFDREGIARLEKRFVIWDDYIKGNVLRDLVPVMDRISKMTQRTPFPETRRWDGTVKDAQDYKGIIHFWYQVRCDLFHGSIDSNVLYVELAYISLNIFMGEIVRRMRRVFTLDDAQRLQELGVLIQQDSEQKERFQQVQRALHDKYISSSDIWSVDMVRA